MGAQNHQDELDYCCTSTTYRVIVFPTDLAFGAKSLAPERYCSLGRHFTPHVFTHGHGLPASPAFAKTNQKPNHEGGGGFGSQGGGGYMAGGAVDSPSGGGGSGGQRNKDKQSMLSVNIKQVCGCGCLACLLL